MRRLAANGNERAVIGSVSVFGFFKKKDKAAAKPVDPLEAFDAVVESMERQGEELRRSAATLLALKAQFDRVTPKSPGSQGFLINRSSDYPTRAAGNVFAVSLDFVF